VKTKDSNCDRSGSHLAEAFCLDHYFQINLCEKRSIWWTKMLSAHFAIKHQSMISWTGCRHMHCTFQKNLVSCIMLPVSFPLDGLRLKSTTAKNTDCARARTVPMARATRAWAWRTRGVCLSAQQLRKETPACTCHSIGTPPRLEIASDHHPRGMPGAATHRRARSQW
jgi:hypothetical protein